VAGRRHELVVGIDVGLDGGLFAVRHPSLAHASHRRMPTKPFVFKGRDVDVRQLYAWLTSLPGELAFVCLEHTHSFGHESRSSCFSFGRGTGRVHATLDLLGVAYALVVPQVWKKAVLPGAAKGKQAAVDLAQRTWPQAGLPAHDGLADAACLALYGSRLLKERRAGGK
jgi:hypothetical protein